MAFNWGPIITGLLSGLGGASAARNQQRGIDAASGPQPYEDSGSREPWGPARDALAGLPGIAEGIFQSALGHGGPPRSNYYRGPSQDMRDIVGAMRERAMGSTFVPQAQEMALGMASGPSPMVQGVYDRAMNYQNPLAALAQRGLGGGFSRGRDMFEGFLSNLLGGQTRLGEPAPGVAPGSFPPSGGQGGSPYPPQMPQVPLK